MTQDRFVNPYQFVPIGPVVRQQPLGHGADSGGVYSGSIEVSWEIVTPLLLPAVAEQEGWAEGGRFVRLPGSSLRGVVRSLHETMFHGCLRILDSDFLPAYRDPAVSVTENWRLAVVLAVENGLPTSVQVCTEREVWVSATELQRKCSAAGQRQAPTSGQVVTVDGTEQTGALNRTEIHDIHRVDRHDPPSPDDLIEPGRQVFLVTDTAVRKGYRDGAGSCFWALGTLTDETRPVPTRAAKEFVSMCAGSNDRRLEEQAVREGRTPYPWRLADAIWTVDGRSQTIGRRRRALGVLRRGDVVWVRCQPKTTEGAGPVERIRLAQIWRHPGTAKLADRLPYADDQAKTPMPCRPGTDERREQLPLCLSCAIFGAVKAERGTAREGRHAAYAGHVRFSSATVGESKEYPTTTVALAPLGAPGPGAGSRKGRLVGL